MLYIRKINKLCSWVGVLSYLQMRVDFDILKQTIVALNTLTSLRQECADFIVA